MIPLNTPVTLPSRAFWYVALRSFVVALFLLLFGALFQFLASAPGASCRGALCGKLSGGEVAALLYLYGAFLVVRAVLNFKWFSFTVTDRSISITSGVLARDTNTIRFDRVQDVNTRRDPLHALLGLESIAIWTASPDQRSSNGRRRPDGLIVLEADDARWLRDYVSDPKTAAGAAGPGAGGSPASGAAGLGGVVVGFAVASGLVILAVLAWGQRSVPFAANSQDGAAPAQGPAYVARRGADGKMHPHPVRTAPAPGQIPQVPSTAGPGRSPGDGRRTRLLRRCRRAGTGTARPERLRPRLRHPLAGGNVRGTCLRRPGHRRALQS